MSKKVLFSSKKAQVASGITWVAATLVIIAILSISIYAASLMSKTKVAEYSIEDREEDAVVVRSILTYFVLEDSGLKSNLLEAMRSKDQAGHYYIDFDSEFNKINKVVGN